jgi:DNA polymerase
MSHDGMTHTERLSALAAQVAHCDRCHLAAQRTNAVFGEGNPDSPLVFVGEGPGAQEDATGRPFVGRAGILLDECLRANNMTRKHVYICNIVKSRASDIENGRHKNRPPNNEEIDACHDWLDQQLKILEPIVIVCLGATSANALIKKGFRMTAERGQWFTSCQYSRYVMAALHPAYILRQAGQGYEVNKQFLIDDIAAARKKVIEAKKEAPMTLF